MRALVALCTLLASCVAPSAKPGSVLFPEPQHELTIPAEGWTMERLVLEYGRATEQRFLFDEDALAVLKESDVPLGAELTLKPSNMHSIVETLLVESGMTLAALREDAPRMVRISRGGGYNTVVPFVELEDLDKWCEHPAYCVRTILLLEDCDTEFMADALRTTLSEGGRQEIIYLSQSDMLLLQGPAPWVAELTRMLLEVNERERVLYWADKE